MPVLRLSLFSSRAGCKYSFSTREVREQHAQIQKMYRPARKRHNTDPVDFEGKLFLIVLIQVIDYLGRAHYALFYFEDIFRPLRGLRL